MSSEPFLLASSVEAFIAQRLVRIICPDCKEEVANVGPEISRLERQYSAKKFQHLYLGKGCESCKFTGFKGRTAIYEILFIDDAIRELILKKSSTPEIKKKAVSLGMKVLKDHGWGKINQGITVPEEVMRVTQLEE